MSFTVAYVDPFGTKQVVDDLTEVEADALIEAHRNGTRVEFSTVSEANERFRRLA